MASASGIFADLLAEIDIQQLQLNGNDNFGSAQFLLSSEEPSARSKDKGKAPKDTAAETKVESDWVESGSDPELLLFIPFKSKVRIQSIEIESHAPLKDTPDSEDEALRPLKIKLFSTTLTTMMDFDVARVQKCIMEDSLDASRWDSATSTATIDMKKYVPRIPNLILFVADAHGGAEKTRIDRIRIKGIAGTSTTMGVLKKEGDDAE